MERWAYVSFSSLCHSRQRLGLFIHSRLCVYITHTSQFNELNVLIWSFFLFSFRGKRGAVCLTRSENNDDAQRTTKVRHEPPFVFPHIGFASTFDAFRKVRFPKVGWVLMSGAKDVCLLRGRRCFIKTHGWVFFDEQISLNHYLRIKLLKRKRRLFDCLR